MINSIKFVIFCFYLLFRPLFRVFFEARAEIQKYFCWFFGSNENFRICSRDLLTFRRGSKAGQDYIECIVEHRKEKSISHSVARTKLVPNLIQLGCSNSIIAFENSPQEQNIHRQVSTSRETITAQWSRYRGCWGCQSTPRILGCRKGKKPDFCLSEFSYYSKHLWI